MLGNNDRIKARFTVTGHIQGDISNVGLQSFLTKAVPAIIAEFILV